MASSPSSAWAPSIVNHPAVTHRIERIVNFEAELLEREKEYLSPEEWNQHAEKYHKTMNREALYAKYEKLVSEKLTADELRHLNESYPEIDAIHDRGHGTVFQRLQIRQKAPAALR